MYYELYIDVFFIENFLVDTMLLISLKKTMILQGSYFRVIAGGVTGALMSSMVICIKMNLIFKYILLYLLIPVCMLVVSFYIRSVLSCLKMLITFYLYSIFLGGMLQLIRPRIQNIFIFCFGTVLGNYLMVKAWKMFTIKRAAQKNQFEVFIFEKERSIKLNGLLDTGNVLRDPVSGDPVCIMDQRCADRIFGELMNQKVRLIPVRTVAASGVIPVIRVDKMLIKDHFKKYWMEKPLIGICREKICTDEEYQIILNRDILGGTKNVSKRSI